MQAQSLALAEMSAQRILTRINIEVEVEEQILERSRLPWKQTVTKVVCLCKKRR